MKKVSTGILTALLGLSLILTGCGNDDAAPKKEDKPKTSDQVKEKSNKKQESKAIDSTLFTTYSSALSGKTFMKEATVSGDKGAIAFYKDFSEYKTANPNSKLTENDYNLYFSTGDGLEKTLFEATSYLFKKIPEMNELSVLLSFEGKTYSYDVKKEKIKNYIGKDKSDDTLRQEFMKKFVKVK
jgi:hypothetical protein